MLSTLSTYNIRLAASKHVISILFLSTNKFPWRNLTKKIRTIFTTRSCSVRLGMASEFHLNYVWIKYPSMFKNTKKQNHHGEQNFVNIETSRFSAVFSLRTLESRNNIGLMAAGGRAWRPVRRRGENETIKRSETEGK